MEAQLTCLVVTSYAKVVHRIQLMLCYDVKAHLHNFSSRGSNDIQQWIVASSIAMQSKEDRFGGVVVDVDMAESSTLYVKILRATTLPTFLLVKSTYDTQQWSKSIRRIIHTTKYKTNAVNMAVDTGASFLFRLTCVNMNMREIWICNNIQAIFDLKGQNYYENSWAK